MSKPRPKTALYFTRVVAIGNGEAVVAGHLVSEGDSPTATVLLRCGGLGWGAIGKIDDIVYSMVAARNESVPAFAAIGRAGTFLLGDRLKLLEKERVGVVGFGYLEGLVKGREGFHACGADRQVHTRGHANGWQFIGDGIVVRGAEPSQESLLCLTIDQAGNIVVAGTSGFVARRDGTGNWTPVDLPTNMEIHCILASADGSVYLAGGGGAVMCLAKDGSVQDFSLPDKSDVTFYDMCSFAGEIYLAAGLTLYKLETGSLRRIAVPASVKGNFYSLSAADSLWCVGDEIVREFTGTEWRIHHCPANRSPKA